LWPTNSAKPLLSRLLLENSNNSEDQATKRKAEEPLPNWNVDQAFWKVDTPQKLQDLKKEIHQVS
jgi:4-hydroxybenzoate polyprenyltransferase